MPNRAEIRQLARQALQAGILPRRGPDRTRSGPGVGAICVVCRLPITRDEVEHEVQFARDGANPGLDRFPLHRRCCAAWEVERTKTHRERGPLGMTASGTSVSDDIRQPFTLAGAITSWNLTTREMTIRDRDVVLEPHLSTVGLETGRRVVVAGYREPITASMVVTRFHLE